MAKFLLFNQAFNVPYLVYKGVNKDTPYYQRRVPSELVQRFGKQMIKIKLYVKDGPFARQALQLCAYHDQLFLGMMNNANMVLPADKNAALGILHQYGLKQGDGLIRLTALQNGGAEFGDQPHLNDIEMDLQHKKEQGTLTESERLAIQALMKPLPVMCSELWSEYLKDEQRGDKWIKKHQVYFDRFIKTVGDMPVETMTIAIARSYRDTRESLGIKSETIQKEIKFIKAVLNKGMNELGLNIKNPFDGVRATNLGQDTTKRETLSTFELKKVIAECKRIGDDIALMMLMIAFTGARLAEIIGLRLEDISLTSSPNYLNIRSYGKRRLKTNNSERILPIHPSILKLVKKQFQDQRQGKKSVLFDRYADGLSMPSSDTASATINKRLAKIIQSKHITCHCFRHTLEDRMRNANISKDRRDEFIGHAKQSTSDNYGFGTSLTSKKADLLKSLPLTLK